MKHSRQDYQNRIVDLANLIPESEPVFLLRAKDACSLAALHAYHTELITRRCSRDIIANVNAALLMFQKFRNENLDKMKLPDVSEAKEFIPASDHPLLTQALNNIKTLEEKNIGLAASLSRAQSLCDEYAERYADLKRLYEETVNSNASLGKLLSEAVKTAEDRGAELVSLKAELKVLDIDYQNAFSRLNDCTEKSHAYQLENAELSNQLSSTKAALEQAVKELEQERQIKDDLGSQG